MESAVAVGPLRVPGFARLAVSYTINELGDNLGIVALAILVLDRTGSALSVAGLFVASKFVPAFVAPALTARLDRQPVARALPALYALEALAFGALALIAGAFSLAAVLVLAFADGTIALTARGLSRAAVAEVLGTSEMLRRGNALLNMGFAVTSAAGPALAGLLVAASGAGTALGLDALSFLVIAVLLATSTELPPARASDTQSWLERVRAGMRYVRRESVVRRLLVVEGIAFVFFFLVIPIEVVYVKRTLHGGDFGFGLLLAAWGLGIVGGSAVFARVQHRTLGVLLAASTAIIGLAYLGLAGAPTLGVACAASALGGLGNGVQWVSALTAVQQAVAPELQARVVGLLESLGAAAPGVGYLLGGVLASVWSPRLAYLVAGVGVLAVVLGMRRVTPAATRPAAEP